MCLFQTLQPYNPMLKTYKRNSSMPSACQATHTRTHPPTHTHTNTHTRDTFFFLSCGLLVFRHRISACVLIIRTLCCAIWFVHISISLDELETHLTRTWAIFITNLSHELDSYGSCIFYELASTHRTWCCTVPQTLTWVTRVTNLSHSCHELHAVHQTSSTAAWPLYSHSSHLCHFWHELNVILYIRPARQQPGHFTLTKVICVTVYTNSMLHSCTSDQLDCSLATILSLKSYVSCLTRTRCYIVHQTSSTAAWPLVPSLTMFLTWSTPSSPVCDEKKKAGGKGESHNSCMCRITLENTSFRPSSPPLSSSFDETETNDRETKSVFHDSCMCTAWPCPPPLDLFVWHDSLCGVTHSCTWHDWCVCVTWHGLLCAGWALFVSPSSHVWGIRCMLLARDVTHVTWHGLPRAGWSPLV